MLGLGFRVYFGVFRLIQGYVYSIWRFKIVCERLLRETDVSGSLLLHNELYLDPSRLPSTY